MQNLYMLEGGVQKVQDDYLLLKDETKIEYIKRKWGDHSNLVIAYYYVAEGMKLKQAFSKALILQYTAFAEGVDLSMYETLVVYSGSFSGSTYSQIRARQANLDRKTPIKVHFLLTKGGISEQVYNAISEKMVDFNVKHFIAKKLIGDEVLGPIKKISDKDMLLKMAVEDAVDLVL